MSPVKQTHKLISATRLCALWRRGIRLKKWQDKHVLIYSGEHRAWWRPNSQGYTVFSNEAGVYTFQDALFLALGCDASKKLKFQQVDRIKLSDVLKDIHKITSEIAVIPDGPKWSIECSKLLRNLRTTVDIQPQAITRK